MFEVLDGGVCTTLQDLGRPGYMHRGITPSGAMDEYAYRWCAKLLGSNSINALEILVGGLRLKSHADTTVALSGADLMLEVGGVHLKPWRTYRIAKGDVLHFKRRINGMYAYLAVRGGFDAPVYKGSVSTTLKEGIGAPLKRGDGLYFSPALLPYNARVKQRYIPTYGDTLTLRFLPGYEYEGFDRDTIARFLSAAYTLTSQINRIGYRLKGAPLHYKQGEIYSNGTLYGAIQVPPDGQPIVLLKEHQTIGGYPKVGTVLALDAFRLAQLGIGGKVRFKEITLDEMSDAMRRFCRLFGAH